MFSTWRKKKLKLKIYPQQFKIYILTLTLNWSVQFALIFNIWKKKWKKNKTEMFKPLQLIKFDFRIQFFRFNFIFKYFFFRSTKFQKIFTKYFVHSKCTPTETKPNKIGKRKTNQIYSTKIFHALTVKYNILNHSKVLTAC